MYYLTMSNKKEIKSIRLNMVISPSLRQRIDDWRSKQADIPSRSEAIRRLIDMQLDSQSKN